MCRCRLHSKNSVESILDFHLHSAYLVQNTWYNIHILYQNVGDVSIGNSRIGYGSFPLKAARSIRRAFLRGKDPYPILYSVVYIYFEAIT